MIKLAYEKPKCDCGDDLIYWVQEAVTVTRNITKAGKIGKHENVERVGEGSGNLSRLSCPSCGKEYEWDFDEKDRVVRGFDWD
ncbi:hypothetical protein D3C78_1156630 [compost metagenome]